MAIPTQFSVAKTRKCPIANPTHPVDGANPLTAESIGFISGASVLPAKSAGDIGAPSELTAQAAGSIDNAVVITSEQRAAIDEPSALTAQLASDIDNASLFSALSVGTIDNPSIVTAEPVAPVDNASALTSKSPSVVDAPNFSIVDRIQWDFVNSLLGWSAVNATLTTNATTMTAVMTGADFQLIKSGLAEGPRSEYLLRIRARCTTATVNTRVSVFTKNTNHDYSTAFMVQSELTEMPQGTYVEFYLNLGEIQDYFVDGLTSLRIDLYEGDLQAFEVDSIWFGRYQTDFVARDEVEPDAPTSLSAESSPAISAPSALTAKPATQTSGVFPLNHARILYNNKLFGYETVTSIKGVPLNALTPNTWQRWIFDSSTTSSGIRIDLPSAVTMDCICIGAHNLGAIGATVSITYSTDGSTFVDWAPDFDVGGRAAIMSYTQTPKQVKSIQIFIQAGTTATGYIGYISAGEALQMQRPFFNGHQPYTDADVTEYYSNRTESGNIIGRQIRRRGYETTYEWQNIDDTWYRNNIPVFKDYAKRWPMFIAWNLLEYPKDVAFGETTGDIKASMQNGTRTKRTGLSFTLKGV